MWSGTAAIVAEIPDITTDVSRRLVDKAYNQWGVAGGVILGEGRNRSRNLWCVCWHWGRGGVLYTYISNDRGQAGSIAQNYAQAQLI